MSWKDYVDKNLVGSGKISRAAILGLQGGVWACSPGYKLEDSEQKSIVNAFRSEQDVKNTFETGVRLGGQKFFVIQAEGRSIYAKKGGDSCVLVKTKQAVLVAECIAPVQTPECATVVEKLADYLIGVQY